MKKLLLLTLVLAASLPQIVCAQSNPPFKNPSLDSNCYFPQIGDPSEMDTIMGGDSNPYFGWIIKNMGTKSNGGYGNMFIGNLVPPPSDANSWTLSQVQTGPSFNLHQMKQYLQKINPSASNGLSQGFVLGHFRDTQHLDIFDGRIYWADDSGNYDTNRYTQLWSNIQGDLGSSGTIAPFAGYFSSDTVEDAIDGFYTRWSDRSKDTVFLEIFKGGASLYLKDTAFEDTSCILFPLEYNPYRFILQGNFRGTGRQDVIIMSGANNLPGTRIGDISFYANDPPFSLEKLAYAINYDTLMAKWQNPTLLSGNYESYTTLAMPALPKSSTDKSVDFLPVFSDTANNVGIYFFRGGPDFGSHRITLDSAAYVIHQPTIFQGDEWPLHIADAGDMTGTGNHVLYTQAFYPNGAGSPGWDAFFVTGQALDDKIDIYYNISNSAFSGDTLTSNADSLEDFLLGSANLIEGPNGLIDKGGLWLYYGSKQIPVHLNPQFSVVNVPRTNGAGISLSPNPANQWSVATIVWPESEDGEYSIYDMLGRLMEHGPIRLFGGAEQQRIYFRGMPQGVYM